LGYDDSGGGGFDTGGGDGGGDGGFDGGSGGGDGGFGGGFEGGSGLGAGPEGFGGGGGDGGGDGGFGGSFEGGSGLGGGPEGFGGYGGGGGVDLTQSSDSSGGVGGVGGGGGGPDVTGGDAGAGGPDLTQSSDSSAVGGGGPAVGGAGGGVPDVSGAGTGVDVTGALNGDLARQLMANLGSNQFGGSIDAATGAGLGSFGFGNMTGLATQAGVIGGSLGAAVSPAGGGATPGAPIAPSDAAATGATGALDVLGGDILGQQAPSPLAGTQYAELGLSDVSDVAPAVDSVSAPSAASMLKNVGAGSGEIAATQAAGGVVDPWAGPQSTETAAVGTGEMSALDLNLNQSLANARNAAYQGFSPDQVNRLANLLSAEVGTQGSQAVQAETEAIMNRAIAQGRTIDEIISNSQGRYFPFGDKGYPSSPQALNQPATDFDLSRAYAAIDNAMAGSNLASYATGNESGPPGPNTSNPVGATFGGERFVYEPGSRNTAFTDAMQSGQGITGAIPQADPGVGGEPAPPAADQPAANDFNPGPATTLRSPDLLRLETAMFGGGYPNTVGGFDTPPTMNITGAVPPEAIRDDAPPPGGSAEFDQPPEFGESPPASIPGGLGFEPSPSEFDQPPSASIPGGLGFQQPTPAEQVASRFGNWPDSLVPGTASAPSGRPPLKFDVSPTRPDAAPEPNLGPTTVTPQIVTGRGPQFGTMGPADFPTEPVFTPEVPKIAGPGPGPAPESGPPPGWPPDALLPGAVPSAAAVAGNINEVPSRGGFEGGPPPSRGQQLDLSGATSAAALGTAAPLTLSSSQQQQVQQVQALQQSLTNQWYQQLLSEGINVNDPTIRAQVQGQVLAQMQQQGINVSLYQQWLGQMAA
jgi:hypothetical protein